MLRCVQLGLSVADLDMITLGMVYDMFIESGNDDDDDNGREATQADFDNF